MGYIMLMHLVMFCLPTLPMMCPRTLDCEYIECSAGWCWRSGVVSGKGGEGKGLCSAFCNVRKLLRSLFSLSGLGRWVNVSAGALVTLVGDG